MGRSNSKKKEPYTKEEREKARRKEQRKSYILGIVIGAIILIGVVGYYKAKSDLVDLMNTAIGDAATLENDILNAPTLTVKGDYENVNMLGSLYIGDELVGNMTEEGTLNPVVRVSAGGEDVISIRKSDDLNEQTSSLVYAFSDINDNVTGYAVEDGQGVYTFRDSEGNENGYQMEVKGSFLANPSGERIGSSDYAPYNTSYSYYQIDATFNGTETPAEYRCFMLYLNYLKGYNYRVSGVMP